VLRHELPVLGLRDEAGRGPRGATGRAPAHHQHHPAEKVGAMMVRDGAAGAGSGGRVPPSVIGISRRERREAAWGHASIQFGADAEAALDILEMWELAWHDCYGDVTPPARVVEDVWLLADGSLAGLASAARLAVTDSRDLHMAADDARSRLQERA
jgi:hypothetical protein